MRLFLKSFLKPSISKIILVLVILFIMQIGEIDGIKAFVDEGEEQQRLLQNYPNFIQKIADSAPWWAIKMYIYVPLFIIENIIQTILRYFGLFLTTSKWISSLISVIYIYIVACFCVELVKKVYDGYLRYKNYKNNNVKNSIKPAKTSEKRFDAILFVAGLIMCSWAIFHWFTTFNLVFNLLHFGTKMQQISLFITYNVKTAIFMLIGIGSILIALRKQMRESKKFKFITINIILFIFLTIIIWSFFQKPHEVTILEKDPAAEYVLKNKMTRNITDYVTRNRKYIIKTLYNDQNRMIGFEAINVYNNKIATTYISNELVFKIFGSNFDETTSSVVFILLNAENKLVDTSQFNTETGEWTVK